MESLIIESSKTKPGVNFNIETGSLNLGGESYPENALEFYKPICGWIEDYLSNNGKSKKVEFNFKMTYFNTSSSKAILDILDILEAHHNKNVDITVNWFYEEDDEDIQESGEEFAEGLTLKYNLISYRD